MTELLKVEDLVKRFPVRGGLLSRAVGWVHAVTGVSFSIGEGETLGLVGESGCGKTTAARLVARLMEPDAGKIVFESNDIGPLRGRSLKPFRRKIQMIFQDPYSSLNPRMRVADILLEGMRSLRVGEADAARLGRLESLLKDVGLPADALGRYPHEFSGGQRQRIAIARALAVEPRLIICDEPTSALDVSVQAQILNLLRSLQRRLGIAYLFITHNIAVVDYLAHEVAVMHAGRIVERGTTDEVLRAPKHEYTKTLLAAVPTVD